ncbi:MAG: hypothetical protein KKH83_07130 [Candidatus Margulisbacteria bacterium]|nr:hypothetical protein [Candidatus Margulisiibacteriota bacterium]
MKISVPGQATVRIRGQWKPLTTTRGEADRIKARGIRCLSRLFTADHSVAIEGGMMMKGLMSTQTLKVVLSSMRATVEAQLRYAKTFQGPALTREIRKEIEICERRRMIIEDAICFAGSLKSEIAKGLNPRELALLVDFVDSLAFPKPWQGNIRLPEVEELGTAYEKGDIILHPTGEFIDETYGSNCVYVSFSGVPGQNFLGEEILRNDLLEIRRDSVAETCRVPEVGFRLVLSRAAG